MTFSLSLLSTSSILFISLAMPTEHRHTQTEPLRARWRFFNGKNLFELISALLLPLMLGIFTIVFTFSQQNLATQQRIDDRQAAEQLRDFERNLAEERYQNELLDNYVKDFTQLSNENDGSLTNHALLVTLARVRTLNILRQLTSQRSMRIIRFLIEAGLLAQNAALDLSLAESRHLDFRDLAINRRHLDRVAFGGMIFVGATLTELEMNDVNLSAARFDRTDFSHSSLTHVDLSFANLNRSKLALMQLHHVTLASAKMNQIDFSSTILDDVEMNEADLRDINYRSSHFFNVRFTNAKLRHLDFAFATLKNVDFSTAQLSNVSFAFARMQNVNFRFAKLKNVDFSSPASDHHYLHSIDFYSSLLDEVNFAFVKSSHVSFQLSKQYLVNFSSSILVAADLSYMQTYGAGRTHSCLTGNSHPNNVTYVSFRYANLKGALFEGAHLLMADFHMANLQECTFNHAHITDDQLRSASSIRHAQLPGESTIRHTNLIQNGQADCQLLADVDWMVPNNGVKIVPFANDSTECYFAATEPMSIMWQRVNLTRSSPVVVFYAKISRNVSVQLTGMTKEGRILMTKNVSEEDRNIVLYLHRDVRIIDIMVYFHRQGWMDDIELHLDDEKNYLQPFRIPIISQNARWDPHGQLVFKSDINPQGIFIDADQTIYIADSINHRIVMWRDGMTAAVVVAGDSKGGQGLHQLFYPTDVIRDQTVKNLIVCDTGNRRVMTWSGHQGELFIEDVDCNGLAIDDQRAIYVVDFMLHEVRRYIAGETNYTIVAGGHGRGSGWHQLSLPSYLFVDDAYSIYVSDSGNHRIMKWLKGAQQGTVVAGGHCEGPDPSQLFDPQGIAVDSFGTIYVADSKNRRIMRWGKNDEEGTLIIDTKRIASASVGSHIPSGLFIDRYDHLYVTLTADRLIQRFSLLN